MLRVFLILCTACMANGMLRSVSDSTISACVFTDKSKQICPKGLLDVKVGCLSPGAALGDPSFDSITVYSQVSGSKLVLLEKDLVPECDQSSSIFDAFHFARGRCKASGKCPLGTVPLLKSSSLSLSASRNKAICTVISTDYSPQLDPEDYDEKFLPPCEKVEPPKEPFGNRETISFCKVSSTSGCPFGVQRRAGVKEAYCLDCDVKSVEHWGASMVMYLCEKGGRETVFVPSYLEQNKCETRELEKIPASVNSQSYEFWCQFLSAQDQETYSSYCF